MRLVSALVPVVRVSHLLYLFSFLLLQEIQETVLRLVRTADQLVHSAHYDAEGVKKRLEVIDQKCEDFMHRVDNRRKNLALAINFFSLAQTVNVVTRSVLCF